MKGAIMVMTDAELAAHLADQAGRLLGKVAAYLPARERSLDLHVFVPIHAMHLKNLLCQIHSNARKVHFGLLPSFDWLMTTPVWHIDAGGREESIPLVFAGMTWISLYFGVTFC